MENIALLLKKIPNPLAIHQSLLEWTIWGLANGLSIWIQLLTENRHIWVKRQNPNNLNCQELSHHKSFDSVFQKGCIKYITSLDTTVNDLTPPYNIYHRQHQGSSLMRVFQGKLYPTLLCSSLADFYIYVCIYVLHIYIHSEVFDFHYFYKEVFNKGTV